MKQFKDKGFTMVEVTIVIAIVALLAAIAIPNIMRANGMITEPYKKELHGYNRTDVEIFCKEQNLDVGIFVKSDVMKNRYDKWLEKEKR